METNVVEKNSIVTLDNRNYLKVTGVEKVFYCTESECLIMCSQSKLQITGAGLNIKKISLEQQVFELGGKIVSLKYFSKSINISHNWLKNMFRKK